MGRQRRRGVPFNPHRTCPGVERRRCQRSIMLNRRLFTRQVNGKFGDIVAHALEIARLSRGYRPVNCRV